VELALQINDDSLTKTFPVSDAEPKELDNLSPKLKAIQRIRTKAGFAQQQDHRLEEAVSRSVGWRNLQPKILANSSPKLRVARGKVALTWLKAGGGQVLC
jgi:hypothetical protein